MEKRPVVRKAIVIDADLITASVVKEIKAIYKRIQTAQAEGADEDELDGMAEMVALVAEGWTKEEAMNTPLASLRKAVADITAAIKGAENPPLPNAPSSSGRRSARA